MLNISVYWILIIIFILIHPVIISQFMLYKNYLHILDKVLIILVGFISSFLITVLFSIIGWSDFITKDNAFLISGVLIGLSALLASTTIMKSIKNTNDIEKNKSSNQEKDTRNRLEFYLSIIRTVTSYSAIVANSESNDYKEMIIKIQVLDNAFNNLSSDNEIISKYSNTRLSSITIKINLILFKIKETNIDRKTLGELLEKTTLDIDTLKKELGLNLQANN